MASQWPPKKGAAFTLYFTLFKNDGTIIANPGTITKKVSIDGAAVADCANTVTEEDTTYGQCSLVLSTSEMNGDAIWVYIKDDTSGCVPFVATLYTAAQTLDEIEALIDDIGVAGAGLTAIPWNASWDAEVQSEVADALAAYDPPTKTEMDSAFSTTNGKIDAVDDLVDTEVAAILAAVDTEVAAIKAKTDNLPSDPADQSAVESAITAAHSTTDGKIDTVDGIVDAIVLDTALIEKWIINKLVTTDNEDGTLTTVLYDTDGSTPLKTWVFTTATGTRAAAS